VKAFAKPFIHGAQENRRVDERAIALLNHCSRFKAERADNFSIKIYAHASMARSPAVNEASLVHNVPAAIDL
jgi:hypothetical protein